MLRKVHPRMLPFGVLKEGELLLVHTFGVQAFISRVKSWKSFRAFQDKCKPVQQYPQIGSQGVAFAKCGSTAGALGFEAIEGKNLLAHDFRVFSSTWCHAHVCMCICSMSRSMYRGTATSNKQTRLELPSYHWVVSCEGNDSNVQTCVQTCV